MSKRNFILLIIILLVIGIGVFSFMYFNQTPTTGTQTEGINFGSIFNPFGPSKPATTPTPPPPTNISGYQPENATTDANLKLKKISSAPVAGFVIFNKERLIEAPTPAPTPATVAPYNFGTSTIKSGISGDAVKELQRFLNNVLGLTLTTDGNLNTETLTAIKQWQTNNKLKADGVVGPKTKALMYSSVGQTVGTANPTPPATEFAPAVRYVDRATGNIYQTFADKVQEKKFTTTTIPKIYEAFFGNTGASVVMRYLKENGRTIETFVGTLPKEVLGGDAEKSEVVGTFLPENITDISISTDTKNLFYLLGSGDGVVGNSFNFSTSKKSQLFSSPFTEWLSSWPNNKIITLTTKPSYLALGYVFGLDLNSKQPTSILGKINGLTTLPSPDGKLILYGDNNLSLGIYNLGTKATSSIGVKTLPEKCVWNKTSTTIYCAVPKSASSGQYPDSWYQGEESFDDQIWKVDTATGNASILIDPPSLNGGEEVDGIKLAVDDGENYLFFVNKKDSFLWKLNLK